jgi:hypothetical protein
MAMLTTRCLCPCGSRVRSAAAASLGAGCAFLRLHASSRCFFSTTTFLCPATGEKIICKHLILQTSPLISEHLPRSLRRSILEVFEDQWLHETRPKASPIRTTLTQSYTEGANPFATSHSMSSPRPTRTNCIALAFQNSTSALSPDERATRKLSWKRSCVVRWGTVLPAGFQVLIHSTPTLISRANRSRLPHYNFGEIPQRAFPGRSCQSYL